MTGPRPFFPLLVMAIIASGVAASEEAKTRKNIALGRSYSLSPRSNCGHCTDPGDQKQLTDGRLTEGYFWTQQCTVGWNRAPYATVTVDLGRVEPISGVSLRTAAGVAGVGWPLLLQAANEGVPVAKLAQSFGGQSKVLATSATAGIASLAARVTHVSPKQESFRAILPFSDAHAELFRVQASLWKALGRPDLAVWVPTTWEPLDLYGPPPEASVGEIHVHTMLGEYRAAAVNLAND